MKKLIISIALLASITLHAQEVRIAGPAPQFVAGEWLKGEAIDKFQTGKIYVLEFWATWCGPCKDAIPHITELANKYQNEVTFVGVNVWEKDRELARSYVKRMGDKIAYNVVLDKVSETEKSGYMVKNWLKPLGIKMIPATIIVGKTGLIEWVGNPVEMDPVLIRLVNNNWNADLHVKQAVARDSISAIMRKLAPNPDWKNLEMEIDKKYPSISADSSIRMLKIVKYGKDYHAAEAEIRDFVRLYGTGLPLSELNNLAWKVFKEGKDQSTILLFLNQFKVRFTGHLDVSMSNALDTYSGLLYKTGLKEEALKNQIKAYSMLNEEDPLLDLSSGKVIIGGIKAGFLITAFKMEKGIPIWEAEGINSVNENIKAENLYWNRIGKRLLEYYQPKKADSLLAFTKMRHYEVTKQQENYTISMVEYVDQQLKPTDPLQINSYAWEVFEATDDRRLLSTASKWMAHVVKDENSPYASSFIDTYANLLYKMGKQKQALTWQQKAIDLAPENDKPTFSATLAKMQSNQSIR